jgi:sortase (surface protein transpeptidase)
MSLSPIERAWNAVKEHKQRRKAAKRAKRKQKEAEAKAYAAQLKRADDLRRIKAPKISAEFVLRHDYEADKVRAGPYAWSNGPHLSAHSYASLLHV